jgi:hypothetical protein
MRIGIAAVMNRADCCLDAMLVPKPADFQNDVFRSQQAARASKMQHPYHQATLAVVLSIFASASALPTAAPDRRGGRVTGRNAAGDGFDCQ